MKGTVLHSTLREMQALLQSPRFWGAIVAVSAILGVTGPFGTYEQLALLPRLAYWLALALATFAVGFLAMRLVLAGLFGTAGAWQIRGVVAGAVAGLPVTVTVLLFNQALFGGPVPPFAEIARLFVNCCLIAAAISFLVTMAARGPRGAVDAAASVAPMDVAAPVAETAPSSPRPPLVDRLPHAVRGRLLYLSMQDHYVEVHTEKGSTLLLMRFADALRETGDVPGIQIHRSHWVALDAVAGNRRQDGKPFLKLADGAMLPVSRTHADAVRKAGLL